MIDVWSPPGFLAELDTYNDGLLDLPFSFFITCSISSWPWCVRACIDDGQVRARSENSNATPFCFLYMHICINNNNIAKSVQADRCWLTTNVLNSDNNHTTTTTPFTSSLFFLFFSWSSTVDGWWYRWSYDLSFTTIITPLSFLRYGAPRSVTPYRSVE